MIAIIHQIRQHPSGRYVKVRRHSVFWRTLNSSRRDKGVSIDLLIRRFSFAMHDFIYYRSHLLETYWTSCFNVISFLSLSGGVDDVERDLTCTWWIGWPSFWHWFVVAFIVHSLDPSPSLLRSRRNGWLLFICSLIGRPKEWRTIAESEWMLPKYDNRLITAREKLFLSSWERHSILCLPTASYSWLGRLAIDSRERIERSERLTQ